MLAKITILALTFPPKYLEDTILWYHVLKHAQIGSNNEDEDLNNPECVFILEENHENIFEIVREFIGIFSKITDMLNHQLILTDEPIQSALIKYDINNYPSIIIDGKILTIREITSNGIYFFNEILNPLTIITYSCPVCVIKKYNFSYRNHGKTCLKCGYKFIVR